MNITRSRRLTVNMGDYENYQFGAEVTVSHNDLGLDDEAARVAAGQLAPRLKELADAVLDDLLEQDIEDAAELTNNRKTFLLKQPAPTPALTSRKVRRS